MTTEAEQQQIIAQGRDAQALKSNPALNACLDYTLENLFVQWMTTGPDDFAERDQLYATAQALRAFKDSVDSFISTGKLEESIRNEQLRTNK